MSARAVAAAFERWEDKPYDLFFFESGGREYVGRKHLASFQGAGGPVSLKCALVGAEMVLGRSERVQVTEAGIAVFYRPVDPAEAEAAFAAFAADPLADLHYPAPHLQPGGRAERVAPAEYWNSAPARVQHLNGGEVFLRDFTVGLFAGPELERARIYDPACSTGEFLAAIKARVPSVWTIGQDLSRPMAELARGRLDEVHHGDCADSPVPDGSADLVFVRHLNVDVVTTERAYELFVPVANRCRDGGRIVVFGHTPVLLASPWFEMLGLTVERRNGTLHGGRYAFQYYVLRKSRPIAWKPPFESADAPALEPEAGAGAILEAVR